MKFRPVCLFMFIAFPALLTARKFHRYSSAFGFYMQRLIFHYIATIIMSTQSQRLKRGRLIHDGFIHIKSSLYSLTVNRHPVVV